MEGVKERMECIEDEPAEFARDSFGSTLIVFESDYENTLLGITYKCITGIGRSSKYIK